MREGVIGESQERFIEGNLRYANMAVNVNMFNVSELVCIVGGEMSSTDRLICRS